MCFKMKRIFFFLYFFEREVILGLKYVSLVIEWNVCEVIIFFFINVCYLCNF